MCCVRGVWCVKTPVCTQQGKHEHALSFEDDIKDILSRIVAQ